MTTGPAVEPLRVAFRREVRERALDAAHRLTLEQGWDLVRMGQVAAAVGVSRPTLYKEFENKQGLGEAMVLREVDRFLTGVAAVLDAHTDDPREAITAAVRFTLTEAAANPLLHTVLTSTRGGDDSLLPLLTTRSAPVFAAGTAVLTAWFGEHLPHLAEDDVAEGVDALVRLIVSHLVLPAAPPEETADRLARVALRYLQVAEAETRGR